MKKVMAVALMAGLLAINLASAEDAMPANGLTAEIKFGTGLENREVTGESDTFPAGTAQLVGWSRITGAMEPTQIMHVWKFNGVEAGSVPLKVSSSPFRTYTRKTVMGAGTYTLEVQDVNGAVIGSKEVQVQ